MTRAFAMFAVTALSAALTACAATASRSSLAGEKLASELKERIQTQYVEPFKAGDIDRWVDVFAQDALAYHDGPPPFKGREAIRQFGQIVRLNFHVQQFDVVVDEVRAQRNWALTAGHYAATFVPRNADAYAPAAGPRQGKFIFLWERQQGVWRVIADMGNSTDPPPVGAR